MVPTICGERTEKTTLTPDTWPYDVPVEEGIGVRGSACPAHGRRRPPPRATAAPDVRAGAIVALGTVETRPPRRLGLPSRGVELDSSTPPPASRGWVGTPGVRPCPLPGGGLGRRPWGCRGAAVGVSWCRVGGAGSLWEVQWHNVMCCELLCL